MKYLIVIEESDTGYSAYSPDLPGCVAAGATLAEVSQLMEEAVALHIDAMRLDGEPIPRPTTTSCYVEVAA